MSELKIVYEHGSEHYLAFNATNDLCYRINSMSEVQIHEVGKTRNSHDDPFVFDDTVSVAWEIKQLNGDDVLMPFQDSSEKYIPDKVTKFKLVGTRVCVSDYQTPNWTFGRNHVIITFLRSSSYSAWDMCPMQYFLGYTMGLKPNEDNGWVTPRSAHKADMGNAVHKALELLARKKLAIQRGEATFREDEIGKSWEVSSFSNEDAFEEAWHHYSVVRAPHWDWSAKIRKTCYDWTMDVLVLNGGMWNPMNRDIVMPEQYFDVTIKEPWAAYNFVLPNGEKVHGQLGLKGTVDLITEIDKDTIEYVDWKTGARKDWASGLPKDWKKLRDDPQLRLYHYMLTQYYPDRKYIVMTIVFIRDGGAFSLDFGPRDLEKTEKMVRERFETIKNCERPPRIWQDRARNAGQFKCRKLCVFGQNNWKDTGMNVCDFMHKEIVTLGLSRVTTKHAATNAFASYGSGGGVENRDEKKKDG